MDDAIYMLGSTVARALLVRVENPGALAASQQGWSGALAAALVPETVQNTVLSKVRDQLQEKLAENGVQANIEIVDDTGQAAVATKSDLVGGMIAGGVIVGALGLILRLVLNSNLHSRV